MNVENLVPSLEQVIDKSKEQMSKWEDSIDDIPMPNIEQYKMSPEEMKLAFNDTFEEGISSLKLTAEEASAVSNEIFNVTQESINALTAELGEKIPSFDYEAIAKDAAISAVAGGVVGSLAGGIGAIPGAIGAGALGATGEIVNQILKHNGVSDGIAMAAKIGVEVVSGAALVKFVGKGIPKLAINSADDVTVVAKNTSLETVSKVGNIVDDVKIVVVDKIKTAGYEIKGLVNNSKIHQFTNGLGEQFSAKIADVIDLTRTIKMPHIGSHLKNTNSAGFLRDSTKFGREFLEQFPETLSKNNIERIKNGLSPIADKQWVKFNPNHKSFIGQVLEHHHINNTGNAGFVPTGLHRLGLNKEIMHVDNMNLIPETMSVLKQKITRS